MSLGTGCGSLDKATQVTIWQTQLPVDYLDATITQNIWETVDADLSGGAPVKFWNIIVEQTNNGAAVETIELEITMAHPVTGVMTPYTATLAGIASGVRTYFAVEVSLIGGDFAFAGSTTDFTVGSPFIEPHQSIPFISGSVGLIRVRQTTAVDVTSASIEVNIVWEKLVTV